MSLSCLNAQINSDIIDSKKTEGNMDVFSPLAESPNAIKGSVYVDTSKSAFERTVDLLKRLTFDEKLSLTGGFMGFQIPPVERLGLRPVFTADASQGIRLGTIYLKGQKSTSFPGMMPLSSTWNKELAYSMGKAMGEECRALGVDILLGPGINMQRLSVGGRNFEYMGEDPHLTVKISKNYIKGLENTGVLSCPKHYIGNDQEFTRHISNSIISERALREIYLPPWKSAIQNAHASCIMTGNNLVNGSPAVMNKPLNADLLRSEYGFTGIAMSDWQNTNYHPEKQNLMLTSGQTLLMPDNVKFEAWVKNEIKTDSLRKAEIEIMLDRMVFYTLFTLINKGVYDRTPQDKSYFNTFETHKELARKIAEESIILLQNINKTLPIRSENKKILLIGQPELHSGHGSGYVDGYEHVTYADGMRALFGKNFEWIKNIDKNKIQKADFVFYNLNKTSGEGKDIPFELGSDLGSEILAISKLNKNVIVLINAANVMPMPWLKSVKAVLWCSYLGQERGSALANIISGKISPSGKLPFTIEYNFSDSPSPKFNFLGNKPYWQGNNDNYKNYWLGKEEGKDSSFFQNVKPHQIIPLEYAEETLIGYRWYDYNKKAVQFPFGYGLTYSKFNIGKTNVHYSESENDSIFILVEVHNSGEFASKEVLQLYVSEVNTSMVRAPKELKNFSKIHLIPNETKTINFKLNKRDFAFWDEEINKWKVKTGRYDLKIGFNSESLTVIQNIIVNKTLIFN
ncbi:MAG: hypothetical protein AUK44_09250 [Porphyromonadaceae bacterium CG2_30_38_12]|nr:MAG: hypothetical protein AUK44_09250 [Porphyromonadaceae bacterium CG2_30_38_12]